MSSVGLCAALGILLCAPVAASAARVPRGADHQLASTHTRLAQSPCSIRVRRLASRPGIARVQRLAIKQSAALRPTELPADACVTFRAWLERSSLVMGEPVILRYRLENGGAAPVALNLVDEEGWLDIELADAAGEPLPRPDAPFIIRAGGRSATRPDLAPIVAPGGAYQDARVLSRLFTVPGPGTYTLRLAADTTYVRGAKAVAGRIQASQTLTFTVLPAEDGIVREEAERLLARVAAPGTAARERGVVVEALVAMPAGAAGSAWENLARTPMPDVVDHATEELAGVGGADGACAASVLVKVWKDAARPASVRSHARAALLHQWWGADPDTRREIEAAFIAREGRMPDTDAPPVFE